MRAVDNCKVFLIKTDEDSDQQSRKEIKISVKIMVELAYNQRHGKHLVAEQSIKSGTVFYKIEDYQILDKPTYQSVQISVNEHLWEKNIIYLNHSCNPNTIINVEKMELCAIRNLKKDELITFFYPSTEWDLRCHTCQYPLTQSLHLSV